MNNTFHSGFATSGIILGIVTLVILGAGGWYIARQQPSPEPTPEVTEGNITTSPVQNHRSYTLRSDASSKSYQPKTAATYTFSIVDDQGTTVKDFATVHEKIMHLIVVRKDLQEFQHLHPDFNQATGQFTLANLTFTSDGLYRIFPDFTPMSAQRGPDGMPLGVTLNEDVNVGNLANYKPQSLTDTVPSKTFQNYQAQLTTTPTPIVAEQPATLTFAINQNGRPVTNLEKYLGALGHSVVLREGDLEFLHTHALDENVTNQTGKVDFAVTFPSAGKYKAFSQFQHQGNVITADFAVTVESKSAGTNEGKEPPAQQGHGLPNAPH